jgi:hypothetical protein
MTETIFTSRISEKPVKTRVFAKLLIVSLVTQADSSNQDDYKNNNNQKRCCFLHPTSPLTLKANSFRLL